MKKKILDMIKQDFREENLKAIGFYFSLNLDLWDEKIIMIEKIKWIL